MGKIKGQVQYEKWQQGNKLTRKGAMLAHCYICNGFETGAEDCKGSQNCPLYQYFSYKHIRIPEIAGNAK